MFWRKNTSGVFVGGFVVPFKGFLLSFKRIIAPHLRINWNKFGFWRSWHSCHQIPCFSSRFFSFRLLKVCAHWNPTARFGISHDAGLAFFAIGKEWRLQSPWQLKLQAFLLCNTWQLSISVGRWFWFDQQRIAKQLGLFRFLFSIWCFSWWLIGGLGWWFGILWIAPK